MMKTFCNLLLAAALCFTLISCSEKGEPEPSTSDLLIGEWKPVASEGWSKDGETVTDSWIWETGDSGSGTHYLFEWVSFDLDAIAKSNKGSFSWTLDGDVIHAQFGTIGSGAALIFIDCRIRAVSAASLTLEWQVQNPADGIVNYEKVTYGRK